MTGRISSLALDPADETGNTLYVGTTGGGVWVAQNAATGDPANIQFTPLTDNVSDLSVAEDASISIGAISVQPGGTGVILAGTGDPNGAPDSYYGAGLLRSTNNGMTWSLIQETTLEGATAYFGFLGEAFAGFAWSTTDPQLVVAAVAPAYEASLVKAQLSGTSYSGLYYSSDAGASWHLSRITDMNGQAVQGPLDAFAGSEGNAATSVVWNPVRNVFIAAVRLHGYYQSSDGATWTRLGAQPGTGLTAKNCPTNAGSIGALTCSIWRGTLAVNPETGDTFAWTVDANHQDKGIWQDVCAPIGGTCANTSITFATQWSTAALQTNTASGSAIIANGKYTLALAAIPSGGDTLLLAGANDLWRCSLAGGCTWRNTTNALTCASAQVGAYQHAVEWSAANPLEVFLGNDSGLWRSTDAVAETGAACAAGDAEHFQNLNGGLGSLAAVTSVAAATPSTVFAGLGVNGTSASASAGGAPDDWTQVVSGYGGPVAIDPTDANRWYANNGAGVSIHACTKGAACTAAGFGASPTIGNVNLANDGLAMTQPAAFLVDPVDPSQLLIGTCRVWRGPADGTGWTSANTISPMLGATTGIANCSGNAFIRSMAAVALPDGGEVLYVGTYGRLNGGAALPGHVLAATMNPSGNWSAWQDLTANPITNDTVALNAYHLDISSIAVDPHDATGNTVYVTVAGFPDSMQDIRTVYRSTDGGAHWTAVMSNLPFAPVNGIAVDPVDANTLYLASDAGVFSTQQAGACGQTGSNCWAPYGAGLPKSPVVALNVSSGALIAGTYGRGIWSAPQRTAGVQMTSATVSPASLTFASQANGTTSPAQTLTLTNTGTATLLVTSIAMTGDFSESDNCVNTPVTAGESCAIQVTFTPTRVGSRLGQLMITANLGAGLITVNLSGSGTPAPPVFVAPANIDFGKVQTGATSAALQVTVENSTAAVVPITSLDITGPFAIANNSCGTSQLQANTDCALLLTFKPVASGPAAGALTLVDGAGKQTVQLSGTGTSPPTDRLDPASLSFQETAVGETSDKEIVTLTNSGDNPLTSIQVSITGPFQQSNTCTTQLPAQSSCAISVSFLPTAEGVQTGTLTVADILKTQTVALSGTGLKPAVIVVDPMSLSFSAQQVGAPPSSPQILTVTNTGGAPMGHVGFEISGPGAASFAWKASTCGATLAPGNSCTVQVVFKPSATGLAIATLPVSSSTRGVQSATVSLNGTGRFATGLAATPAQLTFAPQARGRTSAAQSVLIKNNGPDSAAGLTFTLSGPFAVVQNTCGAALAAGATCSASVVFTPMQYGPLSGALTISSLAGIVPATVALSGIGGLAGAVQLHPAEVSFPATGVGAASDPVNVTITNVSSTIALTDFALRTTAQFKLANTDCPTLLAAGASCTAAVAFAPTGTGTQTGNLTIASTALAADATAPLTGSGTDFTVTVADLPTRTVASGSAASFTLTMAPQGETAGTFTFQCSALPSYAACVFNPPALKVAAGATGMEIVQVTTGQLATAERRSGALGWKGLMLACGSLLVPWLRRRRRALFLLLLAGAIGMSGLTSCASSGGGGGGAPSKSSGQTTPAGRYSIPVVVTSNGVQRTVTLLLIVD